MMQFVRSSLPTVTPSIAHPPGPENLLLQRFPWETRQRWAPHLTEVVLTEGTVLQKEDVVATHAYFPTTAVVAVHAGAVKDPGLALLLVGRRGMLGAGALFGLATAGTYAVALWPGRAWRLDVGQVRAEFERGGEARQLLMDCTQTLLSLVAQTALCVRQHSVDQQLATRLLQLAQALDSDWLPLKQSTLAGVLGIRRERVNQSLNRWQEEGKVDLLRGAVRLLQPAALRAVCCKCGAAMQLAEDRLVGAADR
jgi:CRP-like cAMP-binding protein